MKQITFRVDEINCTDAATIKLMKELDKIECLMALDFENNAVIGKNVNYNMIDDTIKLVNRYYNVKVTEIDNTENVSNVPDLSKVPNEPSVPAEIKDVKNPYIGYYMDNLSETINWSLLEKDATEQEIAEILIETIKEISEKYRKTKKRAFPFKEGKTEAKLKEIIREAVINIDPYARRIEQVEKFLIDIGMKRDDRIIREAFCVAKDCPQITYDHITKKVHDRIPTVGEKLIREILQDNFEAWEMEHPRVREECSYANMMTLLKIFAKNCK